MNVKKQLEETAYQHIKNKIVTRELFPGSRILQGTIVKETGISRTPVHSAILRLKHEGFVDLLPNRGASVIVPTPKEIGDAYEFRILIETDLIRRVCPIISDERISEMEFYTNEQRRLFTTGNIQVFIDLNRKFHLALCSAVENTYYENILNQLYNKCDMYLLFYDRYSQLTPETSPTLKEHKLITEALRSRDVEACVRVTREHLETTSAKLEFVMSSSKTMI